MNRLKSVLEQRSKDWDPRVRRRLFSWRMFLIILLVVSVLSIGNADAGKAAENEHSAWWRVMGVGSYCRHDAAAIILHLYSCNKVDKPMRTLSRAMRRVADGDFFRSRDAPFHRKNKFDYMDISCLDFNRMVQELGSTETMKNDFITVLGCLMRLKTP